MTGRELIEKLQALPEDQKNLEVKFICGDGWDWEIDTVEVEKDGFNDVILIY